MSSTPGTTPPGDPTPATHLQEDLSRDFYLSRAPRDDSARPTLGGIPLLRRLGRGGMGAVYFGIHPRLNCPVAVKVLSPELLDQDPGLAARFTTEARLAARIRSPHVVQTFDVHADQETHFCVMEYVDGETAAALAKQKGGLSEAEAVEIMIAAARGLADAHAAGVIHRDIKPENVLIPRLNGRLDPSRAKLLDLGLAKPEGQGVTARTLANVAMGTPGYLAPEQARDARSAGKPADVFSMGATLYALLTGRAPFSGSSLGTILSDTETKPHPPIATLRPDISPAVTALVDRCLAKDPALRFPDGQTLLDAICLLKSGGTPAPLPTLLAMDTTLKPTPAPPRRRTGLMIGAGVVLILLAGGLALWKWPRPNPGPDPASDLARARQLAKTDLKAAIALLDSLLLDAAGTDLEPEVRRLKISWGRVLNERVTVSNLLKEAAECESQGHIDQALAAITQAEAVDPAHADVLALKARVQSRLRESTGSDQRRTEARRALAAADHLRTRAGEDPVAWQKVIEAMDRAVALADGDDLKLAQASKADALQKRDHLAALRAEAEGDLDHALQLAKQASTHREPSEELRSYLAFLEEAAATRQDAARRRGEFAELSRQAGEAEASDPEAALKLWQRAQTVAPGAPEREIASGRIAALDRVLAERRRETDFADALARADSALANGQYKEARAAYEEALKLHPADPAAKDGLLRVDEALASLGIEDRRRVEDDAEVKAAASGPATVEEGERLLGEAHRALEGGVDPKALSTLKQVYYALPDRMTGAAAAYRLATEYARASDRERALDWLEIALRRDPSRLEEAGRAFVAWKGDARFVDIVRRGEMAYGTAEKRRRLEDRALLAGTLPGTAQEAHDHFGVAYDLLATKARYVDAIREFKRIFYAIPDTVDGMLAAYNVACAAALMGQNDAALDWLEIAVLHGLMQYSDPCHDSMAHHARADKDLKSLWTLERFDRIVRGAVRPFGDSLGGFRTGSWFRLKTTSGDTAEEFIALIKEMSPTEVKLEIRSAKNPPREVKQSRTGEPVGEARVTVGGGVYDCRIEKAEVFGSPTKLWVCREGPEAELIALQMDAYKANGVSREELKLGGRAIECSRVEYRHESRDDTMTVWFCRHVPGGIAQLIETRSEGKPQKLQITEIHGPDDPVPALESRGAALLKELREAYEKAESIRYAGRVTYTHTPKNGGKPSETSSEVSGIIARDGRYRVQEREKDDGELTVSTRICDGKRLQTQVDEESTTVDAPAGGSRLALAILVLIGAPSPDLLEDFEGEGDPWAKTVVQDYVEAAPEKVGDRECRVVGFEHDYPGDPATRVRQGLWIDAKTRMILRRRWRTESAEEILESEETYTITVDGPLKDDEFRVTESPKK